MLNFAMKRGADTQLTRDEIEKESVEPEPTPGTDFKKASDDVLKGRVIRALPNRTKTPGVQSNGTTDSAFLPTPSISSSGSTFTFASPSTATNNLASSAAHSSDSSSSPFAKTDTQTKPFGFPSQSSTSQTTTPPTTAFAFPSFSDKPMPSAPSTVKAFASVLNSSDSNVFGPPAPSNASSPSNQLAAQDEVLFKYYTNLRGLNHSFLNAISKGIEDDPFADMSGILESYKSTRQRIQKEKDDASASKSESSSNSLHSTPSSSLFPLPPAASLFGKPPVQGAQSAFSTSGFSSTPSTTSTSPFSSPSTGGLFGSSPSMGSKALNSSTETPTQSLFSAPSQKPSFFSLPEHTSSNTPTASPFKFGGSTTNQPSSSIFGSSKPAPTFKWGAAADQPATGELIGASDKPSTTQSLVAPASSSVVHFQFGSGSSGITESVSKTTSSDEKTDDGVDGESEQVTPTTDGDGGNVSNLQLLATHNPHDDEGEGEENEISVHAIKVKAYRMRKADAKSGPGWADLGFGILRLKRDKDTSARRMLLRNSTNGKILINFNIYSGLKLSLVKKALTFVGHDNGISQTYCVRLPGEEQAQQLKEALDQEIESVMAKENKE